MCVSPSPMLIWALQRSQYFKIRVAQHWGGRGHITVRTKVWGVNLKNFLENSRKAVSVSTICDEYCSLEYLSQIYAYRNPLTPNITNIDDLLTMPIHSRRQMGIELIQWMLWSFIKPSPLISKEMYGDPSGEFVCGYWGLKGYAVIVKEKWRGAMNKSWTNYSDNFDPPLQPSPAPYLEKLKDEKMAPGMASSLSLGEGGVSGLRLNYIILIQDFRCLP